ncbi:MAG TPA: hypothetical protein VL284_20800 [Thermoanaerobaculia bacterium]|nr:hypothetical protein [Thermoanaerobaculia bacterium]
MSRMRVPGSLFITLLLAFTGIASAQNVSTSPEGLTFHGFIDATAFLQNQSFTFGNGQNAEWPVPPELKTDRWLLDGDVRNTRLTLGFNGPKLENGLKLNATIEGDFFGGFNGTGAFSNAQAIPRLRLAYIDLVRGSTTIRIGQAWSPLFGTVATSYSHIAFPLGYGGTGDVGWRFPGIFVYHDMSPSTKFTLGVFRNVWNAPGTDATTSTTAGPASTLPQVEARFDFGGKHGANSWGTYVVGHVDKKDLSGVGVKTSNDSLTGWAAEFGGTLQAGPASLKGNIYTGKAIGQQFGAFNQFCDCKEIGAWVQGGYNFNKNWSAYLFAGEGKPKKEDILAAKQSRVKNVMLVPSLMYNNGPYGFNVEWVHDRLTTAAATGAETNTNGDQLAASVIFKF